MIHVDPTDAIPIWKQIEEGVRRHIASGALAPGDVVPSVRDLSKRLRVNPATVAKAYQRLSDAGFLAVRRGEGTFVADGPPPLSRTERRRILQDGASRYAAAAITVGASRDEAVDEIEGAWMRLTSDSKKGGTR